MHSASHSARSAKYGNANVSIGDKFTTKPIYVYDTKAKMRDYLKSKGEVNWAAKRGRAFRVWQKMRAGLLSASVVGAVCQDNAKLFAEFEKGVPA